VTRQQILVRIELARLDARAGAEVAARLRSLDLDVCTDAELFELLGELEAIRRAAAGHSKSDG
jgi:hypothetical protein